MKITSIGKPELIALRPQIDAALAALGEQLGLKLRTGNASYSPDGAEAHFKLEIKVDDPAVQEAADRAEFERNCIMFRTGYGPNDKSLERSDFGIEFASGGRRYKLTGLELKRRKYPIKVRILASPNRDDIGKTILLTEMAIHSIAAARPAKAEAPSAGKPKKRAAAR